MNSENLPITPFPLMRSLLWFAIAVVVLSALFGIGLPTLGWESQLVYAMVSLGVCAGLGVVGFLLIAWFSRQVANGTAYGFMLSIGVRLIGCAAVVIVAQQHGVDGAFTFWMASIYLVLLFIEVAIVARVMMQCLSDVGCQTMKDVKEMCA